MYYTPASVRAWASAGRASRGLWPANSATPTSCWWCKATTTRCQYSPALCADQLSWTLASRQRPAATPPKPLPYARRRLHAGLRRQRPRRADLRPATVGHHPGQSAVLYDGSLCLGAAGDCWRAGISAAHQRDTDAHDETVSVTKYCNGMRRRAAPPKRVGCPQNS